MEQGLTSAIDTEARGANLCKPRTSRLTVALTGNPNSGKSTIFNNLTGARQHVGNYPGVTVEKKSGEFRYNGVNVTVVDLPGTYSLAAESADELIAKKFVLDSKSDVVVDIIDAANLERNLYLAIQLLEMKVPLILVLNMSDVAVRRGINIDTDKLSSLLGVPVIKTVGHKKLGMADLASAIIAYPTSSIEDAYRGTVSYFDQPALDDVSIASKRYRFITDICGQVVRTEYPGRRTRSDMIDSVLTSRAFGLPIFLLFMWLTFHLSFTLSEAPMSWLETTFGNIENFVNSAMSDGILKSLLVDGMIAGVGGILSFVPIIMLLFLAIAILEDSGYMARAAFITDRIMSKIGLHGKAFIPLLLGFGCGVPAIMATRTLNSRKDRLVTILIIPLMSCGARLPVYALLIAAFFSKSIGGYVLFSLYILGVLVAIVTAKLFQRFLFRGPASPLVMELPPYKMPAIRGLLLHMWERAWLYIKRAGTVLLAASILIWALCNFPNEVSYSRDFEFEKTAILSSASITDKEELIQKIDNEMAKEKLEKSYAGRIGHFLAAPLSSIGLGDWRMGVALFAGFAAKEVVVSTIGVLFSLGGETTEESVSLRNALRADPFFTTLNVISLLIFVLLYLPCISLMVVLGRETHSIRWPIFAAVYLTGLAWITSFIVYQGGMMLGMGT